MTDNKQAKKIIPKTLKGFRDFLPEDASKRQYAIDIIRKTFELYGFEPLETPALEYEDVLLGKYGKEGDKLMYRFVDNGGRKVALRYDQTVPLARVIAQYPKIQKPFKRYQIQPVWRADNTQKGRFREFLQCDADIVGVSSTLADAESISVCVKILEQLGLKNYKIEINDRNALDRGCNLAGITSDKKPTVFRELDKLDKQPKEQVFTNIYIATGSITSAATIAGPSNTLADYATQGTANTISKWLNNSSGVPTELTRSYEQISNELGQAKLNDNIVKYYSEFKKPDGPIIIQNIKETLSSMGIEKNKIIYNGSLARGLDYYTGLIFEVRVDGYNVGSIAGGGRYDKLIGNFTGNDIPAVGFAFGFDRLIEVITQNNFFAQKQLSTKVLVTIFSSEMQNTSISVVNLLRANNITTDLYLDPQVKLDKQLKYADQKGIPFVVIIGPDEAKNNVVTLKNLKTKEQKTVKIEEIVKLILFEQGEN